MIQIKKTILTLVALLAVTTGAWADETPLLTIESKDYKSFTSGSKTFDDMVTVTFSDLVYNDGDDNGWYAGSASLLTVAGINGYTITSCKFYTGYGDAQTGYTVEGESPSVYLYGGFVYNDASQSVTIGYEGVTKIEVYGAAEPTEWSLTPDETGKKWTLAEMPASNVELQVEYFAESNLFLGKEALADAANISVLNGETAVAFDDDGKSTTTVTEGNTVTAKFTGKKVLGMKVAKKETTTYKLLSAATAEDIGKVVCAAGHLHEAKTAVPDGCTAVGILGKVTSTGGHGLILALKDAKDQNWNTINGWTSASYAGTTLKVLPDDAARGTNLTSYTTLGETTVSNWAVAQKSDYVPIFVNLGSTNSNEDGTTYDGNVNAYFTGVGGTERSNSYLSTTESDASHAWYFGGGCWAGSDKSDIFSVWPVLGF